MVRVDEEEQEVNTAIPIDEEVAEERTMDPEKVH